MTRGLASTSVTITGTQVSGSGFFDPGTNPPAGPAFNHISATVPGAVVNSVTYNSPTSVTLNLNTVNSSFGPKDVTITNPDGQMATGTGIITITSTGGPAGAHIKTRAFDTDAKSDVAVWQSTTTANWLARRSSDSTILTQINWGLSTPPTKDIAVAGDYDGDGKADIAVWRPSEGNWYIINSATNTVGLFNLGGAADKPVPNTYLPQ